MIKIIDLVNARFVINNLANQKMKAKPAFLMANNAKKLAEALEGFDEAQKSLYEEYGEVDKETGQSKILPENMELFTKEMDELFSTEVEDITFNKINLDLFDDLEITPGEMALISLLIDE